VGAGAWGSRLLSSASGGGELSRKRASNAEPACRLSLVIKVMRSQQLTSIDTRSTRSLNRRGLQYKPDLAPIQRALRWPGLFLAAGWCGLKAFDATINIRRTDNRDGGRVDQPGCTSPEADSCTYVRIAADALAAVIAADVLSAGASPCFRSRRQTL
jgi:hypothetical protein